MFKILSNICKINGLLLFVLFPELGKVMLVALFSYGLDGPPFLIVLSLFCWDCLIRLVLLNGFARPKILIQDINFDSLGRRYLNQIQFLALLISTLLSKQIHLRIILNGFIGFLELFIGTKHIFETLGLLAAQVASQVWFGTFLVLE